MKQYIAYTEEWTLFITTAEYYFALLKTIATCEDVFPTYLDS